LRPVLSSRRKWHTWLRRRQSVKRGVKTLSAFDKESAFSAVLERARVFEGVAFLADMGVHQGGEVVLSPFAEIFWLAEGQRDLSLRILAHQIFNKGPVHLVRVFLRG
jgi:hypothetical protein